MRAAAAAVVGMAVGVAAAKAEPPEEAATALPAALATRARRSTSSLAAALPSAQRGAIDGTSREHCGKTLPAAPAKTPSPSPGDCPSFARTAHRSDFPAPARRFGQTPAQPNRSAPRWRKRSGARSWRWLSRQAHDRFAQPSGHHKTAQPQRDRCAGFPRIEEPQQSARASQTHDQTWRRQNLQRIGHGRTFARPIAAYNAAFWAANKAAQPISARPNKAVNSSRVNGRFSPVAWISIIRPSPAKTKFASTSALESSA